VASILAALWNEHILIAGKSGLQDTNDIFLANMQKDGSYSVVPRVAGGEVTPDKGCSRWRVAKKYKLYTKITGGQRIDLFGAQLNHLPAIWRKLLAAGFETGHAYGKALRTVKILRRQHLVPLRRAGQRRHRDRLENRYKGLRTPHKIKFVSRVARASARKRSPRTSA
jgi:nitrite reductase (NADH) large subunit